jgi:hypothetical protein
VRKNILKKAEMRYSIGLIYSSRITGFVTDPNRVLARLTMDKMKEHKRFTLSCTIL